MPKKSKAPSKPLYKSKPPKVGSHRRGDRHEKGRDASPTRPRTAGPAVPTEDGKSNLDFSHAHPLPSHAFTLRDDGSIQTTETQRHEEHEQVGSSRRDDRTAGPAVPTLIFSSDSPFLRLYQGNCLELLDAIAAKYPDGRFDAIFADPPYFLSNGGITCHAGKMVKVDKGDWDKSNGSKLNHEFNYSWLERCQKVLKPNGTIWVTGTHHVIFSIGFAMQQLGYKILNGVTWEKPNPPPNLSCRYLTHSTETIVWAAKDEESKHIFNYDVMRAVTGKQMKTVWPDIATEEEDYIWTMTAPGNGEKEHGKHPTQKPVALIERCLLASTNEGDLVLDPFLGGGTTAVAAIRLKRGCVGVEADLAYISIAAKKADKEIVLLWLREFRVRLEVEIFLPNDLDLFSDSINGSRAMDDKPQVPTERIFHECKFVFLSCAQVERGAVVHTTIDVSLQEAWAKTPNGKKRETTHVVRCETEIFRVKV